MKISTGKLFFRHSDDEPWREVCDVVSLKLGPKPASLVPLLEPKPAPVAPQSGWLTHQLEQASKRASQYPPWMARKSADAIGRREYPACMPGKGGLCTLCGTGDCKRRPE